MLAAKKAVLGLSLAVYMVLLAIVGLGRALRHLASLVRHGRE